jgi:protein TonB
MWEKTLIGSNVYSRRKSVWTIPFAAVLHGGILFGIIFFSLWRVEAMDAPEGFLKYWAPIRVSIGPPPAYGRTGQRASATQPKHVEPIREVQPSSVSPLENQSEPSNSPLSSSETGSDSDLPIGDPNGVQGGYPGSQNFEALGPTTVDSEEPQVVTVNMTEPVLIRRVEPEYPKLAMMAHMQGIVILQAVIARTGSVEEVKTLRADYPILEKSAKEAVLQWQYKPATLRGQPVKVYFTVTVTFHLK